MVSASFKSVGLALAVLAIIIFVAFQLNKMKDSGLDIQKITQEVEAGEALLLDVRTDQELEQEGYAAPATHFELSRLESGEFPNFDKESKVYVYCRSGGRAGQAQAILEENGFSNVENIGGLSDWIDAGGEVSN